MTAVTDNTSKKNSHLLSVLLLYIIWPFGAWLYSLRRANTKASYLIFFLFSLLLCWHMSPNDTTGYDDFIGILQRFKETFISTQEIQDQIKSFFSFDGYAPKELYENVLIWFVKSFTSNYHFFFLLASIPVAWCQLKCMKFITDDQRYIAGTWMAFLILAMFIFPRDIITVQNPRFSTGLWWCLFVTIQYGLAGRNKLWCALLILLAPIFHSGLWVYVGLFYISIFIPNRSIFISVLEISALASIPFCFIDADLFSNLNLSFLPDNMSVWVSWYMDDDARAALVNHEGASGFWMVGEFFNIFLKLCYIILTVQIIKNRNKLTQSVSYNKLYICYLVIFAIINLLQFVPELGARYFYFTRILCVLVWFKFFWGNKQYYRPFYLLCIVSLWHVMFRYGYVFGGALAVNTPIDIFFMPLPYLIGKGLFW